MSIEPVRFIHAANVLLDRPLNDVGPLLDEAIRDTIQQATLVAFQRVVAAAIEREVDFLLLTGNTFIEDDHSLRAEIALLDGFRQLADHQIRVVVQPGRTDPADAWRSIPALPENVCLLGEDGDTLITRYADDSVIAGICRLESANRRAVRDFSDRLSGELHVHQVFRIGLLTAGLSNRLRVADDSSAGNANRDEDFPAIFSQHACDYLALGGNVRRRSITFGDGIAHHPGAPQGITLAHEGAHGCTLVEAGSDHTMHCTFVPTAPVRREAFRLSAGRTDDLADLAALAAEALEPCRPEANENVWLINWTFEGNGPLLQSLANPDLQARLMSAINDFLQPAERPPIEHVFHVSADFDEPQTRSQIENNRQATEYFDLLEEHSELPETALESCLKDLAMSDDTISDHVQAMFAGIDHRTAVQHARRLGLAQFARVPE